MNEEMAGRVAGKILAAFAQSDLTNIRIVRPKSVGECEVHFDASYLVDEDFRKLDNDLRDFRASNTEVSKPLSWRIVGNSMMEIWEGEKEE